MFKLTSASAKVNKGAVNNSDQGRGNDKHGPNGEAKRPTAAVSQQFLPKKQQNAPNAWRSQEEHPQPTYGYVPFKSPLPIYSSRVNQNGQTVHPAPGQQPARLNSQVLMRQESMSRAPSGMHSRPGSDMGMCEYRGSGRGLREL